MLNVRPCLSFYYDGRLARLQLALALTVSVLHGAVSRGRRGEAAAEGGSRATFPRLCVPPLPPPLARAPRREVTFPPTVQNRLDITVHQFPPPPLCRPPATPRLTPR